MSNMKCLHNQNIRSYSYLQESSVFEEILITPRNMLDKATMVEALHAAAGPYKELEVFNFELMTLHREHFPRSKRSRGVNNGKGKPTLYDKVKAIKDAKEGKGSAKDKSSGKGSGKSNAKKS